jgi:hypothetical protein
MSSLTTLIQHHIGTLANTTRAKRNQKFPNRKESSKIFYVSIGILMGIALSM